MPGVGSRDETDDSRMSPHPNPLSTTRPRIVPIHRMDSPALSRRRFVQGASWVAGSLLAGSRLRAQQPANRVVVGVMGLHRGRAHLEGFLTVPGCDIGTVCDVDRRAAAEAADWVEKKTGRRPREVVDFRTMLDDRSIDAISIAAPNHWHAPATILACDAGKHVYVEKPGSHNPREAQWMVAAARKHRRLVQMGNQRRSWTMVREVMDLLHGGILGKAHAARSWYHADRTGIGRGRPASVPDWLDYSLWQGPAPERPYLDNVVHYNWHWRWHWGGGELANNGPHFLDLARWGLGVDCPIRVSCTGGRHYFRDDQETPDTIMAAFDFGSSQITWECHSCNPVAPHGAGVGVEFLGEGGSLLLVDSGWKHRDSKGRTVREGSAPRRDSDHFLNFIEAIRGNARLNSEIAEGQKSTLLCHLGNIAWRTGQTLHLDPKTSTVRSNRDAAALWGRDYRKGWRPKV
jgi:predicted dehydrogenase